MGWFGALAFSIACGPRDSGAAPDSTAPEDSSGETDTGEDTGTTLDPALPELVATGDGEGYVLFNASDASHAWVLVADRTGRIVWYASPDEGQLSTSSALSRDGSAVLFNSYPGDMLEESGSVKRVPLDGSEASSISTPGQHHDFVELPDGSVAYIASRVETWEGAPVIGDEIRVTTEEGPAVTVFSAWDTFTPSALCAHFEPVTYADGAWDWLHANSLRHDEDAGAFLMMSRNADALYAIDDTTGALRWQLGGAASDFTFTDDRGFDHGHFSHAWEGGFAVFDNGMHQDPPASRAVAYAFDEVTGTVTRTWSVETEEYNDLLGDVRQNPDGSWIVSWSVEGRITEYDDAGATLWELQLPGGFRVGHASRIDSLEEP